MTDMKCHIAVAGLLVSAVTIFAGHPTWPPPRHSPEYRQANMLFLRFQDALASEQWQEAIAMCSERVRSAANGFSTPDLFFHQTMPVDLLLAQDFGYWSYHTNFYGLFVTLTAPEATPVIQWHWAILRTNGAWVVDYPPVPLESYVANKRAAIEDRDSRTRQIRAELEPRAKAVETRLTPVSEKFVIGSPMLFKVELINHGELPVHYTDSGVAFAPLTVLENQRQPLVPATIPLQILVHDNELARGASVVLAGNIDLNRLYTITKPGKYSVQFSGADLAIGKSVPHQDWGSFGENELVSLSGFVAATNSFPSNSVEIDVAAAPGR
jgi:hypothetical protein